MNWLDNDDSSPSLLVSERKSKDRNDSMSPLTIYIRSVHIKRTQRWVYAWFAKVFAPLVQYWVACVGLLLVIAHLASITPNDTWLEFKKLRIIAWVDEWDHNITHHTGLPELQKQFRVRDQEADIGQICIGHAARRIFLNASNVGIHRKTRVGTEPLIIAQYGIRNGGAAVA